MSKYMSNEDVIKYLYSKSFKPSNNPKIVLNDLNGLNYLNAVQCQLSASLSKLSPVTRNTVQSLIGTAPSFL
jgi:hypothetical protein